MQRRERASAFVVSEQPERIARTCGSQSRIQNRFERASWCVGHRSGPIASDRGAKEAQYTGNFLLSATVDFFERPTPNSQYLITITLCLFYELGSKSTIQIDTCPRVEFIDIGNPLGDSIVRCDAGHRIFLHRTVFPLAGIQNYNLHTFWISNFHAIWYV